MVILYVQSFKLFIAFFANIKKKFVYTEREREKPNQKAIIHHNRPPNTTHTELIMTTINRKKMIPFFNIHWIWFQQQQQRQQNKQKTRFHFFLLFSSFRSMSFRNGGVTEKKTFPFLISNFIPSSRMAIMIIIMAKIIWDLPFHQIDWGVLSL